MADKNNDPAHLETEATLKRMEAKIAKEYKQATEEMQDKIDDYWSRYKLKDQKWQEWVADGKKTADQYKKWQQQQLMVGKSWESLKDSLAQDMHNANVIAKQIAQGYQPEIFANNFNYAVYESEVGAKVNTSFTLYDKNTVNRLLEDDPDFIPPMGRKAKDNIAKGLDIPWNKKQVQSAMVQGMLQGESIPQLSKRIATTVGEKNYKSAIRNARTMTTGVQNAGRMEGYKRSVEMGIDMEVEWNAVKDNRTRHEHRQLDGQRQPVGQPFEVHGIKIEYAGDPHAPAHMIYNCRCTLRGIVAGLEPRARKYRDDSMIDGMSYNEWKAQKKSKSNPITLPEEKGEAIARKYRREYAGGGSGKKSTKNVTQTVKPESELYKNIKSGIEANNIQYKSVEKLSKPLTEEEIIKRLAGGDMTKGSCSSLSYAYIANKQGYDVLDFRGGSSRDFFAHMKNISQVNKLDGLDTQTFFLEKESTELPKILESMNLPFGKEYKLNCGKHAAIIRNTENGFEYLELQSQTKSGWKSFTQKETLVRVKDNDGSSHYETKDVKCKMSETLESRFGCRKTKSNTPNIGDDGKLLMQDGLIVYGERVELTSVDSFKDNDEFIKLMGYINTDPTKQMKGDKGGER